MAFGEAPLGLFDDDPARQGLLELGVDGEKAEKRPAIQESDGGSGRELPGGELIGVGEGPGR